MESGLDQRTGRTYYFDTVTRESRWDKPMDELETQVRCLCFCATIAD
jgi:hypothetical protein